MSGQGEMMTSRASHSSGLADAPRPIQHRNVQIRVAWGKRYTQREAGRDDSHGCGGSPAGRHSAQLVRERIAAEHQRARLRFDRRERPSRSGDPRHLRDQSIKGSLGDRGTMTVDVQRDPARQRRGRRHQRNSGAETRVALPPSASSTATRPCILRSEQDRQPREVGTRCAFSDRTSSTPTS